MPDAFIWYHANETLEPALLDWLKEVEEKADVEGKLYLRKEADKTTFMECYNDVTSSTIKRIEKLAMAYPAFEEIERRCESFIRVDNY